MNTSVHPSIRTMQTDDISRVYLIERRSNDFPWNENILRDCLRVGYQCLVMEAGESAENPTILGFSITQVAVQECHIMNICIDPDSQGKGLGGVLFQKLLSDAKQAGADRAFLEVRESNKAARYLYKKFGFDEIGRRKRYYPAKDGREDAIMLALTL